MDAAREMKSLQQTIRDSGEIARAYFHTDNAAYSEKADWSVVTEIDVKIEEVLLKHITTHFPSDTVIGEEHPTHTGQSGASWYIDPIDGTDNLLRRVPFFAISVARLHTDHRESFGIVYNPIAEQMFFSTGDSGVLENGRDTTFGKNPMYGGKYVIMLARGIKEPWMKPAAYAMYEALAMEFGRCITFNCVSLELTYLATNRFDASLIFGLQPYDYAAGLFLAKTAGATISVFEQGAWVEWRDSIKELCARQDQIIFVSHPDIHQRFLGFIGNPREWAD